MTKMAAMPINGKNPSKFFSPEPLDTEPLAHAFEWGKLLKCHLKGKSCRKWENGLKVGNSEKNLDPRDWSAPTPAQYTRILQKYSKIFFSETTWPVKAQFYRKHLWDGEINAVGLNINDSERNWTPGVHLPQPRPRHYTCILP